MYLPRGRKKKMTEEEKRELAEKAKEILNLAESLEDGAALEALKIAVLIKIHKKLSGIESYLENIDCSLDR